MRSVGRAIVELKKANLKPSDVWADDGGLGKPMNDRMREQGWPIKRVNFGGRLYSERYVNRSAEIWWETARQIERAELILPSDEILDAQLCSRKAKVTSAGKMGLESKDEMKRRSRPEDYDGHTEFDRMSPAQRLAWLDEATLFVWKQKARASRAEKIGRLK